MAKIDANGRFIRGGDSEIRRLAERYRTSQAAPPPSPQLQKAYERMVVANNPQPVVRQPVISQPVVTRPAVATQPATQRYKEKQKNSPPVYPSYEKPNRFIDFVNLEYDPDNVAYQEQKDNPLYGKSLDISPVISEIYGMHYPSEDDEILQRKRDAKYAAGIERSMLEDMELTNRIYADQMRHQKQMDAGFLAPMWRDAKLMAREVYDRYNEEGFEGVKNIFRNA